MFNKNIFENTISQFFDWITEEEFDGHDCHNSQDGSCEICEKYYSQNQSLLEEQVANDVELED